MTIQFDCPSCKAHYEVADDLGGKMIMCRVCKKRGPVKSTSAANAPAGAALASVAKSSSEPSRRSFLLIGGGVLASLGAIATGALLARWQPFRHWGEPADTSPDGQRRRRRGPPDGSPPGGPPPGGPPPAGPPAS
jgi:hypothetical protein